MSREKLVKFCDEHGIRDGVLRNFLAFRLFTAAEKEIQPAIERRTREIAALKELKLRIREEM